MNVKTLATIVVLTTTAITTSFFMSPVSAGACAKNSIGQVICSEEPFGGATTNSIGQVKTGVGECVRNSIGQVMCSSLPGGGAAINSIGQAVCQGGCVSGQ